MTLIFKNGDIFSEPAEAIVNTVNCVGVMGKGIALEFKARWPENYKAYKKICDNKELSPGKIFIFDTNQLFTNDNPRYLINFPTKNHWRAKSKLSYIEDGLDALVIEIKKLNIKSIAIPPLGCGNGGLNWSDVKPIIESKLSNISDVSITVFEPIKSSDKPEFVKTSLPMTFPRAVLLKTLGEVERYFDGSFDRISLQKLVYFLQAFGVPFNLNFSKNLYGPYSESLKKAFIAFEKDEMIAGFTSEERQTHVTRSGFACANDYLDQVQQNQKAEAIIKKLDHLIQGYESPYGLELLSSVHWLANNENYSNPDEIVALMQNWTEAKRNQFDAASIQQAYKRLKEDQLIQ